MTGLFPIDHVVIGGPNLEDLRKWWISRTGATPVAGGSHVGRGTRNLLVGLGPDSYVELIGPDPAQPEHRGDRPFGLDSLTENKLLTFAIAVDDIDAASGRVRRSGIDPGSVESMSRAKPDGSMLAWRIAFPPEPDLMGVMPFLIEWEKGTPHPASELDPKCRIVDITQTHPRGEQMTDAQRGILGLAGAVSVGPPRLTVSLDTPLGSVGF